jgi:esterase/lipase superfamily enzyme
LDLVLAAADANNEEHARWVDKIRARRRVYVTINEDDKALQVSRLKAGEEQQARLGHYPFNLHAKHAAYVQFTDASKVGSSHAYFEGKPLQNPKVRRFFRAVLNGKRGDRHLVFDPASNTFRL